ncbi:MAG: hypothetical protein MUE90_08500 [Thermoanaerobaculales bacterium]|jgi:hypothetical protein|nr:hypothetical protein [Thermoanaerobaculales bacterium]
MMHEEDPLATECQAIQESLTELRGEVRALAPAARAHVDACPECREAAAAELALALVFRAALPPADPAVERAVMAALGPVRLRRRIVALLPVAASLGFVAAGAALVGGVPGSGVPGLLPGWTAQGWTAFVARAAEWYAAAASGAGAAAAVIDPVLVGAAATFGLLGLAGVVTAALRWRKISPWRDRR